MHRADGRDFL